MDVEEKYEQLKQALANTPMAAAEQTNACQPKQYQNIDVVRGWSFDDIQSLPAFSSVDLSALTSADIQAWTTPNTAPFANSTVTLGGSGTVTLGGSGGSGAVYTVTAGSGGGSGGVINPAGNWAKPYTTSGNTTIEADDIKLRGKSLMASLDRIEQRLGILDCDEQLEQHWDKLKALGDEYRELKQHIEDKMKTFETLKSMPRPEIK